jgi:D-glycero-alpha-D-manno-heptose-7-phosphate kinase
MIIARSPLRITLGGGGTDLPSYYRRYGGFVISAAIDKYVYVTVNKPFTRGIFLKYSKLEHVDTIDSIQHPIIREALRIVDNDNELHYEITSLADIPAGTGLGSSGSFTTALLKALYAYRMRSILPEELARLACEIEIDRLGEPIGKQDQYIAAYGGITCFSFQPDDSVEVFPLKISQETFIDLEDNLLLFFTGYTRRAGSVLKDQDVRTQQNDDKMLQNMHYVKELASRTRAVLEAGKTAEFGEIMHEHWLFKRQRSAGMSNPQIDEWYELGLSHGALGGKLAGAGGGGFLVFYAENKKALRQAMAQAGLDEVRFRLDFEGSKIILV